MSFARAASPGWVRRAIGGGPWRRVRGAARGVVGGLGSAAEEEEGSVAAVAPAAGDGGGEEAAAGAVGAGGGLRGGAEYGGTHGLARVGVHRGAVDVRGGGRGRGATGDARDSAVGAVHRHSLGGAGVGEHGEDNVARCGHLRGGRGHRRAHRAEGLALGRRPIVNRDLRAGADESAGHLGAHDAEAEKADTRMGHDARGVGQ